MKEYFYSHLVSIDSLVESLHTLELSAEEKLHLHSLITTNLHYSIIDLVLSELTEKDKQLFLLHMSKSDDQEIWKLLNKKTNNIEEKIKATAEEVKKELHEDIKEVKKK